MILDGTLVDSNGVLPFVYQTITDSKALGREHAVATNQGGVGLRRWMEDYEFGDNYEKYPTEREAVYHIERNMKKVGLAGHEYRVCYAYQSKKSGNWYPPESPPTGSWSWDWRKPGKGMLVDLMQHFGVRPSQTLFVGDQYTDERAAVHAGCSFMHAADFFKWR